MQTIEKVRQRMEEALEAVRREFGTVRTGKATPALLDTVRVDAYGAKMQLNQVASVSTPEAALLLVQPFDRSLIGEIEKAIQSAGLGLNPANDGQVIRVPIPALNEERRKEYVKLLSKMAEEGRVSIRHARREGNEEVKSLQKDGEISDDDAHRATDEIQKLTDRHISMLDEALAAKEKEVMTV
ncbi:MAG: ribosome recycling factor [Gemmatimonadales bacterium]|nr:MAG: ribosome recycling factor [Gemmatimonadales bacterium]